MSFRARVATVVLALSLSLSCRPSVPEYRALYWQDGACVVRGYEPNDYAPGFRLCVNVVGTTEAGTLDVLGTWKGNAAVRPADGAYLMDDTGNRYELIRARGVAASGAHLAHSLARGAFEFASPAQGTTHIELHDDTNSIVMRLELAASSRTDRAMSAEILANLAHARSVSIRQSWATLGDGYERAHSLSLGSGGTHQRFLETLMRAPLLDREYRPNLTHTDDYPHYEITLAGVGEPIVFSTSSQGDGHVPWAVRVGEKSYVIPTDTPARALALLEDELPDINIASSSSSPDPYARLSRDEKALWNPPPPRYSELVDAAEAGDVARVQALLAAGADVNEVRVYDHETPLSVASRNDHADVARVLTEAHAGVGGSGMVETTPLGHAAASGNLELVRRLVDAGADMRSTEGDYDDPALIVASDGGHIEVVRFLLDRGVDVNAVSTYARRTALGQASSRGHVEVVRLLLDHGANVHAEGLDGATAVNQTGDADVIRSLVGAGADVDHRTKDGTTALMRAAMPHLYHEDRLADRVAAVRTLLELGADVQARDAEGRTALMFASAWGDDSIAEDVLPLLLQAGARIYHEDKEGHTALFYAAGLRRGHVRNMVAFRLLLEAGADPFKENNDGESVFSRASRREQALIEELWEGNSRNSR